MEKEIREMVPFTIVTKTMKYLDVTLTKQEKDLQDKNFKPLKKEIEEDPRRWKDLPCSWIGKINILKMAILPKAIQIQCNPHQNSNPVLHGIGTINVQFYMEQQKTQNS